MTSTSWNLKTKLILVAKLVIFTLVVAGVWFTISRALGEIEKKEYSLADVDFRWIVVAGLAYLTGTLPCWAFWHRTLWAMGQQPTLWESFRAYYMSHLGKYVPGKAMVVVLRAGWIRSERTDTTVAAISVFVEVLTFMAVAAFVAGLILCIWYPSNVIFLILAVGLMVAAGAPTAPPVMRFAIRLLRVGRINPDVETALDGLNYRLTISGWITIAGGWFILGGSLWCTLAALPGVQPSFEHLPLLVACLALSTVAGFVSMLPGGIGVREYVAMEILQYLGYKALPAAIAVIVLRLAWLLSEATILVILYLISLIRHEKPREEKLQIAKDK